jgi:hypothetical protein
MRSIVCLALVLCLGFVAVGEQTFRATITKVDGDSVTFKVITGFNKETKTVEYGDPVTLKVGDKVVVAKGTFNKETKMVEPGDAIEGGLKAETFTKIGDKGVRATIITDGDKDAKDPKGAITKILTGGGKGK